jgi:hypothetical protein
MSDKVFFNLFGKPAIILIADILFAISVGHLHLNGQLIEVSELTKLLSFTVVLLTITTSSIWLLVSSYSYYSHRAGHRMPCKHCGDVVSIISNSCLHCHKHQWY